MSDSKSSEYPIPYQWQSSRWVFYLGGFAFGGFGSFLWLQLPNSIANNEWLRSSFFLFAGLSAWFLGLLGAASIFQAKQTQVHSSSMKNADGRTVINAALGMRLSQYIFTISTVIGGSIFCLGLWSNTLDLPLSGGQRVFFPLVILIAVIFSLVDTVRIVVQAPIGNLVLAPDSLSFKQTFKGKSTVAWRDIVDVAIASHKSSKDRCDVLVTFRTDESVTRTVSLDAHWPSIGGAATYWLVRFYFTHPELREELSDHRAIDRIRSYRVLDPNEPIVRRMGGDRA
ncbi:hypothetical protein HLB23_29630 [Nocardia uniformis]|uniref:Uncharacterized protein n=1 Tax=Nocardia uniformis TaxID=53432 RepID=A0A849C842_9NOCA|nr:hypothetical protein [Nocardia uniformis]NNH73966.1 hypothetical protein [Nocardia uniformis]